MKADIIFQCTTGRNGELIVDKSGGAIALLFYKEGERFDEYVSVISNKDAIKLANAIKQALVPVDGPQTKEMKQMDNEQIERIEIEDEERCEDCGCTPDEGACFYCKMD